MCRQIVLLCRLLPLLVLLTGCGIVDYFFLEPPEDTAQELYESGMDAMKEKNYAIAAEDFTKLKDRYPFSPYTPQAELALGDAFYLDKEFLKAMDAYKEFEALHPGHEQIPYVLFQIGMSGYQSFDSIDKPQSGVTEALQYFYRLKESYPDSKYAQQSTEQILKCRRILADHELFVANFYWSSKQYLPAWKRYIFISQQFEDLPEVVEFARRRAELAYYQYQSKASQEDLEHREGSWKDWFSWL